MYPGTIPIKAAARRLAPGDAISAVKLLLISRTASGHKTHRYVASAVRPENAGAIMTQTFLISTGILIMRKKLQINPEVTIRPG